MFTVALGHHVLVAVVLLPAAIWIYSYVTCGVCKSKARMNGKTVLITGCTAGIGKATAFDLARRGARVIMACRNLDKAHHVKESIIAATKNSEVVVRQLDVSLLSSVREFAEEINRTEARLDVLIHNAGINELGAKTTPEGLHRVWATNHLGPFLLTHLLIDLLKRTARSRIVVVSSLFHFLGGLDPNNANPVNKKTYSTTKFAYLNTKFANVLITNELARRLKGTGVTANCLHPGAILTSIWDKSPMWLKTIARLSNLFFKTEEQGAQTTIYLAVSEEVEGVTGKYFHDCKNLAPAKKTMDEGLAKKFWQASEEAVQLRPTDPHI